MDRIMARACLCGGCVWGDLCGAGFGGFVVILTFRTYESAYPGSMFERDGHGEYISRDDTDSLALGLLDSISQLKARAEDAEAANLQLEEHRCQLAEQRAELLAALQTFVAEYVALVESGDAGHWDAETEPKVIAARAAIAKASAQP